jgi:ABC-type glycerol-3-phosphate transport system substrate-binding protein
VAKARKVITGAMLAAALAGCSSHPGTPTSAATTQSQSYKDGVKAGAAISLPNETAAQMQDNCAASVPRKMPGTDVKSEWMSGCEAGIIQAEISSGDSG